MQIQAPTPRHTSSRASSAALPADRRLGAARRGAALAVTALAAATLISACGSSSSSAPAKSLDVARVTLSIEQSILSERHIHAKVSCPAVVVQKKGNSFTCYATGTTGSGKHKSSFRTPFVVTQVNDSGYVNYHS